MHGVRDPFDTSYTVRIWYLIYYKIPDHQDIKISVNISIIDI